MIEKSIRFWEHIEISKKLDELTLHQEKITSLKTESNTAVPKIQDVQHKKRKADFSISTPVENYISIRRCLLDML